MKIENECSAETVKDDGNNLITKVQADGNDNADVYTRKIQIRSFGRYLSHCKSYSFILSIDNFT